MTKYIRLPTIYQLALPSPSQQEILYPPLKTVLFTTKVGFLLSTLLWYTSLYRIPPTSNPKPWPYAIPLGSVQKSYHSIFAFRAPPHPNPLNSNFRVTPPLVITPYHSRRVAVGHIFMCFYTFYCIFSIFLLKFWLLWVISLFVEPPPLYHSILTLGADPPPFGEWYHFWTLPYKA